MRLALGLLLAAALWTGFIAARIEIAGQRDEVVRSDAIIVLGAAQYDGRPSPIFRARLDHAAALYRRRIAPLVVVAGAGRSGDRYTEAEAGAQYLEDRGVPERALMPVGEGEDTLGSLRAVAPRLLERDAGRVVLVSDRFHMYRASRMAEDLGLEPHGSPTPDSPVEDRPLSRLRYTLREVAAYTAYLLGRL